MLLDSLSPGKSFRQSWQISLTFMATGRLRLNNFEEYCVDFFKFPGSISVHSTYERTNDDRLEIREFGRKSAKFLSARNFFKFGMKGYKTVP